MDSGLASHELKPFKKAGLLPAALKPLRSWKLNKWGLEAK
jgi:hypothetical protein